MKENDCDMEEIMSQLADFALGPYQLRQHLLHLMSSFVAGVHMLALTFTASIPEHRCFIPEIDEDHNPHNIYNLSRFIPVDADGKWSSCLKFSSNSSATESCGDRYHFDSTYYTSSRVIDWALVCDKSWMRSLLQSIYMMGVLWGCLLCGALSDRFGRKPVFCLNAVLQFVFGIACAFAPNYFVYAIALFFYGAFGSGGIYVVGFTLSMEVVGASKRTLCGTAFSLSFAVGTMAVAIWAWLLPYGHLLQVIYAAHGLLLCGHWWLIDESIPWLWSKGRTSEAVEIATKALLINGKYLEPIVDDNLSSTSEATTSKVKTKGILSLFLYPNLRFRILTMAYAWFANSLAYYGLAFNIGTLPGNPFLMGILNSLAEMPGYIIVFAFLDRVGRRSLESLLCFLGGLACILVAFIPQPVVVIGLAMLAKVAIAGSFSICYNYAAELFPTSVRNSVLGVTSMAARAAGMLTPVVIFLAEVGQNRNLPTLVFGGVAVLSALLTLFLPETTGREMPQEIEEGEEFGRGDTAFQELYTKYFQKKTVVKNAS